MSATSQLRELQEENETLLARTAAAEEERDAARAKTLEATSALEDLQSSQARLQARAVAAERENLQLRAHIKQHENSRESGSERVEVVGAPLKDASGDPLEVGRGAPLDFYIHSWAGNKTKHHLFGNEIYLPGSEHHGKKYGYAWNEILVLDVDNLAAGADSLSAS